MMWLTIIAVMLVGLGLSAFFSGAETGIYCLSRLRLHLAVQRLDSKALRLAGVLDDDAEALAVTLIGTNLANYITTTACAFMFVDLIGVSEIDTELYTVAILTPIVFVFGEVVPKTLFQQHADRFMLRGSGLLAVSNRLFRLTGALWCFTRLAACATRLASGGHLQDPTSLAPKRRVAILLQDALAGETLGEDQTELIDRVCQLSETPVHAVMVPRDHVTIIAAKADRRELVRVARRTTRARLPVYDLHRTHIIGLVEVDELLQVDNWTTVREHLQPAMSVSPHEPVASAMARLQAAGRQMAVVTDRSGLMLGIVTLRDLLGEVVGELASAV